MKYQAVLFDCDGVLVDSESITNGVLRDMLEESGWQLTLAQCMAYFVGKSVHDERQFIESHTGQPLTEAWMDIFRERRNQGLVSSLQPIDNALAAVKRIHTKYAGRIACASGADRF